MSVFVSDFTTYTVTHDDAPGGAHQGTIDPASIVHTTHLDGSENHNFLLVTCPVCGAVSTHPVGGGAQPVPVQSLFTVIAYQRGCPCGQLSAAARSTLRGTSGHVREHCEAMDGPERWQLDDAVTERLERAIRNQ